GLDYLLLYVVRWGLLKGGSFSEGFSALGGYPWGVVGLQLQVVGMLLMLVDVLCYVGLAFSIFVGCWG
ncbi:hypothetical protein U1Q18_010018, partial [Sarracenia purpurea var. burkii]